MKSHYFLELRELIQQTACKILRNASLIYSKMDKENENFHFDFRS